MTPPRRAVDLNAAAPSNSHSRHAGAVLAFVLFLSGVAALLFETLWFNRAGLAFGNSIWATSLVLSAFMGGLALGNGVAARWGATWRNPVRVYAFLELAIAGTGIALVAVLPALGATLAPLLRPLEGTAALAAVRLSVAFVLLLVPTTAMGATLPLLVHAMTALDRNFGVALGRLYGWNTAGAVLGALTAELFLVQRLGVRGTAFFAAALDVLAAASAWLLYRQMQRNSGERARFETGDLPSEPSASSRPPQFQAAPGGSRADVARNLRPLAAAFLAGAILLALEALWFRFLLLFVHAGSLIFAVMLAVVLAGIGAGGFVAGTWSGRRPNAHHHAATVACAAGVTVALLYRSFGWVQAEFGTRYVYDLPGVLALAAALMLPGSFLSGMLFPLLGMRLRARASSDAGAAGLLTLANTSGGMLGAATAGFLWIPLLGVERSFFAMALLYGVAAALLWKRGRRRNWLGPAALALALVQFPFGMFRSHYAQVPVQRWDPDGEMKPAAFREGRTETLSYLRKDFAGEPEYYKLVTNGFSMSGTTPFSRRYMKLFVYFPVALHPAPRRALLISYGVGSTARALADTKELETIDVVDISREILEMSDVVYPDPARHPLRDPRVRVHLEDGRYFLLASREHWDLITGEPPPPKVAGVVNLYTKEYFQLVYDHLAEGGIHTYWLPVHNLYPEDTRAILAAYCEVFPDCTLWSGIGLEWMLMGTRHATGPGSETRFTAQWRDPAVVAEMQALGVEVPEQLGALFMADAPLLRRWAGQTQPLVDDWPKRLTNRMVEPDAMEQAYAGDMHPDVARQNFAASAWVEQMWPADLRTATLPYFEMQQVIHDVVKQVGPRGKPGEYFATLHRILSSTPLVTLALWHLGLNADQLPIIDRQVAAGADPEPYARELGLGALAKRDHATAARWLDVALKRSPDRFLGYCRSYALCAAGRLDEARSSADLALQSRPADAGDRAFWRWAHGVFGVTPPARAGN